MPLEYADPKPAVGERGGRGQPRETRSDDDSIIRCAHNLFIATPIIAGHRRFCPNVRQSGAIHEASARTQRPDAAPRRSAQTRPRRSARTQRPDAARTLRPDARRPGTVVRVASPRTVTLFVFALTGGCLSTSSTPETGPADGRSCDDLTPGLQEIRVGEVEREYVVDFNPELDDAPRALVFIWHGFGGYSPRIVSLIDAQQWPEAIRVAPKGLPRTFPQFGKVARRGWQIRAGELGDRDLAFFDALLDRLLGSGCVDPDRVYTTGFSNGGFFSNLLACHRADRLAGAAPIGGGGPFAATCPGSVPVLIHHGTEDRVVPFALAERSYRAWQKHNRCEAPGSEVAHRCTRATGCQTATEMCTAGIGHRIPKGATDRIVAFFQTVGARAPRPSDSVDRPSAPRFTTGTSTIDSRFVVAVDVKPYETFVDARPIDDEEPSLDWRPTSRQLRFRWASDRPADAQVELLRPMLAHLIRERGLDLEDTSLFGDLSPWRYPDYAARLARRGARDPKWKAALEESKRQSTAFYRYILQTTQTQPLHPELDAVFAPFGRRPRLTSVEKCLRSRPAAKDELHRWLEQRGIEVEGSLPAGCLMAAFELEPR